MPEFTLSQLKSLSRKTQMLAAIALLLSLTASVFLTVHDGGKPRNFSEAKQVAQTQKTGAVLGANTDTANTQTPVTDSSKPAASGGSAHQQTPNNQPTNPGTAQNPAPTPTPAANPCDKTVAGPVVTQAATNISFVESVTIPVGCSTGPFTVKTTDNRSVLFYGFSNKPTSPVKAVMDFTSTSNSSSAKYTVVITDAATPGYYEDFAYVEDASFAGGGYAVTIKITVIPR